MNKKKSKEQVWRSVNTGSKYWFQEECDGALFKLWLMRRIKDDHLIYVRREDLITEEKWSAKKK